MGVPIDPKTPTLEASATFAGDIFSAKLSAGRSLFTPPHTPTTAHVERLGPSVPQTFRTESRRLTDNELSYFLPSRADGVNDMYVHHRVTGDPSYLSSIRVLNVWAYLLLRHPILTSSIHSSSYEDVHFVRAAPATLSEALAQATDRYITLSTPTPHDGAVIDAYLNGPRTLSADRLSCLVFTHPSPSGLVTPPSSPGYPGLDYDCGFMLCATHFIGDGMALHTFMDEFYTILGSSKSVLDLQEMITDALTHQPQPLPSGLEDQLRPSGKSAAWDRAVGAVDYRRNQVRLAGNQVFPVRPAAQRQARRTVAPSIAYDVDQTKRILASCKANGVTIAHVVFALCNIAWARVAPSTKDACILYSAANLRPHIPPSSRQSSYFHLAIGYFSISLPSLHLPLPQSDLLWHRAKSVKSQMISATRSTFVVSRSREQAQERRVNAVEWAALDDGLTPHPRPSPLPMSTPLAPQKALMGVSMLGNLDGMYKHAEYPGILLKSLMTGSRQRSAGLLLFAYTFRNQLWLSLGYDVNGFAPTEMAAFWNQLQDMVQDILIR